MGAALARRPKNPMENKKSGRPSTSHSDENIDRLHSVMLTDRQMTVQMIANELKIGKIRSLDFDGEFRNEKDLCQDLKGIKMLYPIIGKIQIL
jgi:hypothetical protein